MLRLQIPFVLYQPRCKSRDAFFRINFRLPTEVLFRQRDIQRAAHPVWGHFCGVGVLADLEFQIRQRFLNRSFEIFADVGFVEADVVGAAERFVGNKAAATSYAATSNKIILLSWAGRKGRECVTTMPVLES